jgi:hypothetical protein
VGHRAAGRGAQAGQRSGQRRLAASRLPHEREDLAAPDVEGQVGHTVERAEELIRETIERNGIVPETVHADRGTSMTSK